MLIVTGGGSLHASMGGASSLAHQRQSGGVPGRPSESSRTRTSSWDLPGCAVCEAGDSEPASAPLRTDPRIDLIRCRLGWQESLELLARFVEPDIQE